MTWKRIYQICYSIPILTALIWVPLHIWKRDTPLEKNVAWILIILTCSGLVAATTEIIINKLKRFSSTPKDKS